jgi:hypothetical protein
MDNMDALPVSVAHGTWKFSSAILKETVGLPLAHG